MATSKPQPMAPGSPLTMGPGFAGAPIYSEDAADRGYPVRAKDTGTGLLAPAPAPPNVLTNDYLFHAGVPALGQRLLLLFSWNLSWAMLNLPSRTLSAQMAAWETAADAVAAALAGSPVTVVRAYAFTADAPGMSGDFLTDITNFLAAWAGQASGPGGVPDLTAASAVGFTGDVLAYYGYDYRTAVPSNVNPPPPDQTYQMGYALLRETLRYDTFRPGSLPLNHRFQAYVSRLAGLPGVDPFTEANEQNEWAAIQAGFGGAYPSLPLGPLGVAAPGPAAPDLSVIRAFFGI